MLLVDHQTTFGGNVFQCPAQVDGIEAELGEWICLGFQLGGWIVSFSIYLFAFQPREIDAIY